MSPLYVSFYTVGNGYDAEAADLGKTLDHWDLPHDLLPIAPLGSWEQACGYKPIFLQAMRRKHGRRPLVWLDADARVRANPSLFLEMADKNGRPPVDFAAHWKDDQELLSGTLYFGAASAADRLLEQWAAGCIANPGQWDQRVLQQIVEATDDLNVFCLPAAYTLIFDTMREQGPPVIEHMQASRRLRQ
jgi:hypothetical protein